MERRIVDLPIIICGKKREITENTPTINIDYETGITLRFPKITDEDIKAIKDFDVSELRSLRVDDISMFMREVGMLWEKNLYDKKEYAIQLASEITGYDRYVLERDYSIATSILGFRAELYDQLESELGSYMILDEWQSRQECLVKAVPRGKCLHVLVGNLPIAATYSVIRGMITKNATIAKLPSRDPVSSLYFLLSFLEVNPDHPLSKSISVCFWKGGDDKVENKMLELSDVVCIWGGENAVKKLRPKIPYRTECVEFGPKQSICILDMNNLGNVDRAAAMFASQISLYNQEGCFSPLFAFMFGTPTEEFITRTSYWLDINSKRWPKGYVTFDDNAHITRTKLEEMFKASRIVAGANNSWQLIFRNELTKPSYHPLGRTIFIYQITDIQQVVPFLSRDTQTVGVYPWEIGSLHRDLLADHGVDRICELGIQVIPRIGFPHDSQLPLAHMVRWVNLERPMSYKGKYWETDKEMDSLFFGYYDEETMKMMEEQEAKAQSEAPQ